MIRWVRARPPWWLLVVAGCSSDGPPPQRAELEGEAVARVGDEVITTEMVAAIASEQHLTPPEALELATFDALVAAEAKHRHLDVSKHRQLQGALARVLLGELANEARAQGPATDEEVEMFTRSKWIDVARPEAVMVVHAVVQIPKDADERALAVAKRVREAVEPAAKLARETTAPDNTPRAGVPPPSDPPRDLFVRLAKEVDPNGLKLTAEPLWPIGSDNLSVQIERRDMYDPAFVSGAFKLEERGALSEPFRSDFGFHVVLLLDRLPGSMLSLDERRRYFHRLVIHERVARKVQGLLADLRSKTVVDAEDPSLEAMLEQVKVAP